MYGAAASDARRRLVGFPLDLEGPLPSAAPAAPADGAAAPLAAERLSDLPELPPDPARGAAGLVFDLVRRRATRRVVVKPTRRLVTHEPSGTAQRAVVQDRPQQVVHVTHAVQLRVVVHVQREIAVAAAASMRTPPVAPSTDAPRPPTTAPEACASSRLVRRRRRCPAAAAALRSRSGAAASARCRSRAAVLPSGLNVPLVVAGSLEFNVGEKRAPLSVSVGIPQAAVLGDVGEADEGVAAGAGLEELQELVVAEAAASAAARELLLGERARRPSLVIARDAVHLVDGFVALLAQVRLSLGETREEPGQEGFVGALDRSTDGDASGNNASRRARTRVAGRAEG